MKPLLVFLFSFTLPLAAQAQLAADSQNIYSFGGNCSSQGSWTAAALSQTAAIRTIILQIANDKDCTGLADSLIPTVNAEQQTIHGPTGTVTDAEGNDNAQTFTEALYGEAALPNSGAAPRSSIINSLMNTALKSSLFNLNNTSAIGSRIQALNQVASASARTMDTALGLYDQLATSLPSYKRCLIARPSEGAALLAGVIKLGAAFASSGAGVASHWGSTTAKIVNLMRNEDIAQKLKIYGNTDLMISMSCLIESTSQAFCSAHDAQDLLEKIQSHKRQPGQPVFQSDQKTVDFDSPLAGYYILTQHLPNISSWLQEILLSADPKWTADGNRMAAALDNVNNFLKSLWILKGTFRENINTMMTSIDPSDLKGRQNSLLAALVNLINNMNVSQTTDPTVVITGTGMNFFTQSMQSYEIPFFLMGVPTPKEVAVNALGTQTAYNLWIGQDNFSHYPEFNDPVKLADTIEINLKALMKIALTKASNYYRNRIIVNKEMVVNKTLINMPYDVKESLGYIYLYLDNFEKLLRESAKSNTLEMIPSVRNTKYKIKTVLDSYKILDDIVDLDPREKRENILRSIIDKYDIKDVDPKKDNGSILITAAYEQVLQTAYDQFDILLQRDSFLTTSLSTYIYADYVLKTRNKIGVDQYTDDLLLTTGQNLLNLLTQIHGISPNLVKSDLSKAQVINKNNIEGIAAFFKDSLLTSLEKTNMTAHNVQATDGRVNYSIANRLFRDVMSGRAFYDNSFTMSWASIKGMLLPAFQAPYQMWERARLRPDLYPFNWTTTNNGAPAGDTDHHDFANLRNILCIQVLAFEDRKFFRQFCQEVDPDTGKLAGIVLRSPQISDGLKNSPLNASWDQYMSHGQDSKPVTDHSICAFRDFNRRGLANWLTENLKAVPSPETLMQKLDMPAPPIRAPLDPHVSPTVKN